MNENIEKIISIIKNDLTQENHLFNLLAKNNTPLKFFSDLHEAGYFEPEKNPIINRFKTKDGNNAYSFPHWNVLDYLLNCANAISNDNTIEQEVIDLFINTIEEISKFNRRGFTRNNRTDWYLIRIMFALPSNYIKIEYIRFIKTAISNKYDLMLISNEIYKTIFPKILSLHNEIFLNEFLSVFLSYKRVGKRILDKYTSIVEDHYFTKSIQKYSNEIALQSSRALVGIVLHKIGSIINDDNSRFNVIQIKAIDGKSNPHHNYYEELVIYLIRDLIKTLNAEEQLHLIRKFLAKTHVIYKRLAFYIIDISYDANNNIFWNYKGNPLNISHAKHEIYMLIHRNSEKFGKEETEKLISWIEEREYFVPEDFTEERKENYLALRKKEWVINLPTGAPKELKSLYEKYNEINDYNLDYPGYNYDPGPAKVTIGIDSPMTEEEIRNKTPKALKEVMTTFKENDVFGGPSKEGFAEYIKNAIAENPDKYIGEIDLFNDIENVYQYSLINGFYKAIQDKKDFNTGIVLDYCAKVTEQDKFWDNEKKEYFHNYKKWIVSAITDFIYKGAENNKLKIKCFGKIKSILFEFIKYTKPTIKDNDDIVTKFLNSTRGRVWGALVVVSLWYIRTNKLERGSWDSSIENTFNKYLNEDKEESFELYAALGLYLSNLMYLNKNWVIDNINRILPKEKIHLWGAAFKSYLFSSSTIYFEVYDLLKQNQQYEFALQQEFKDYNVNDRLVQHICFGYFEDKENLSDSNSLIYKLLYSGDIDKLKSILRVYRINKDYLLNKKQHKVKPIWQELYNITYKNKDNPKYQTIASELVSWLKIINTIDEDIYNWLSFSVEYLNDSFPGSLSENFMLHVDKTPEYIGKLFLQMVRHEYYPHYKEEEIRTIVEKIFKVDYDTASAICNLYLKRNDPLLKDVQNKYIRK